MARLLRAMSLTILWSTGACADGSGEPGKAALAESFQLCVGHSTVVDGAALEIGFQSVTGDSRCPKGEVCIWEGDATVRIWVQPAAGPKEDRVLHASSKGPHTTDYGDWNIRLVTLDPYPITGRSISQADYVVTLRVTSGPSGDGEIH
jgi:hypothetical protein